MRALSTSAVGEPDRAVVAALDAAGLRQRDIDVVLTDGEAAGYAAAVAERTRLSCPLVLGERQTSSVSALALAYREAVVRRATVLLVCGRESRTSAVVADEASAGCLKGVGTTPVISGSMHSLAVRRACEEALHASGRGLVDMAAVILADGADQGALPGGLARIGSVSAAAPIEELHRLCALGVLAPGDLALLADRGGAFVNALVVHLDDVAVALPPDAACVVGARPVTSRGAAQARR